jgi:hypothetical protein
MPSFMSWFPMTERSIVIPPVDVDAPVVVVEVPVVDDVVPVVVVTPVVDAVPPAEDELIPAPEPVVVVPPDEQPANSSVNPKKSRVDMAEGDLLDGLMSKGRSVTCQRAVEASLLAAWACASAELAGELAAWVLPTGKASAMAGSALTLPSCRCGNQKRALRRFQMLPPPRMACTALRAMRKLLSV